jgi:hypothetical protein
LPLAASQTAPSGSKLCFQYTKHTQSLELHHYTSHKSKRDSGHFTKKHRTRAEAGRLNQSRHIPSLSISVTFPQLLSASATHSQTTLHNMFDRRLLVICIVATAMYVAPVLAQFFLALCSWSIIILGSDDFTPFTITMHLWAVEFYYTTEYTSVLVVLYISAFTAYYDDPVSFSFVRDCLLTMIWRLSRHIRLLLN